VRVDRQIEVGHPSCDGRSAAARRCRERPAGLAEGGMDHRWMGPRAKDRNALISPHALST
jgi:hypothetical protein